jgi:hypothetical protein
MADKTRTTKLGPTVFYLTLVAVLAFFWWFLIYNHGVTPTH